MPKGNRRTNKTNATSSAKPQRKRRSRSDHDSDADFTITLKPRQETLETDLNNNTFGLADHWAEVTTKFSHHKAALIAASSCSPSRISKFNSVGLDEDLKAPAVRALFKGCGIGLIYETHMIGQRRSRDALKAALSDKELMSHLSREKLTLWEDKWQREHNTTAAHVAEKDASVKTKKSSKAAALRPLPKAFFAAIPMPPGNIPDIQIIGLYHDLHEMLKKYADFGIELITQPDREFERAKKGGKAGTSVETLVKRFIRSERKRIRAEHPKIRKAELERRFDIFKPDYDLNQYPRDDLSEYLDELGYEGKYIKFEMESAGTVVPPEPGPWEIRFGRVENEKPMASPLTPPRKRKKPINTSKFKFGDVAA